MSTERVYCCLNVYSIDFFSYQFMYQISLVFVQSQYYKVFLLSRPISECQLRIDRPDVHECLYRVPIFFISFCFSCDCLKLGDVSGDSLPSLTPLSLSLFPYLSLSFPSLPFPQPSRYRFMLCSRFWLCANCEAVEVERNAATLTATLAAAQHSYAPLLLMKANDNYAHTHTRRRTRSGVCWKNAHK